MTSAADSDPEVHTERESDPWAIRIPDHPGRADSPEYVASRKQMNTVARGVAGLMFGAPPYQDHHGGGLWLKDDTGWFVVKNVAGIEWSAQFCADPRLVDALRANAARVYAGFPQAVDELAIASLLKEPITDADGVARWTDSICNASVPLPAALHTGTLPQGGGVHHYPGPITDIQLFKYTDFQLWVTDDQGHPAAVVPVAPRGSGDGRVEVLHATPGTELAHSVEQHRHSGTRNILPDSSPLAMQAFRRQN